MACTLLPLTTLLSLTAIISLFIFPALCSTNVFLSSMKGRLNEGQSLVLNDYTLIMEGGSCQLALYKRNTKIWNSGNWLVAHYCFAVLESNGELKIIGTRLLVPGTVWSSGKTSVEGDYALAVKYDATFHVYGPALWTAQSLPIPDHYPVANTSTAGSTMWSKDVAHIGTVLVNTDLKLELTPTCDLAVIHTKTNAVLWHTSTVSHANDCYLTIAVDGELLIKHYGGATLWGNGAKSEISDYVLVLQPNAKLVVFGPSIFVAGKPTVTGEDEKIAMVTEE